MSVFRCDWRLPSLALVLPVMLFFLAADTRADRVVLKSGTELSGTITKRTEDTIVLQTKEGEEKELKRSSIEYFAVEKDQVKLKNGDLLTGEIVSENEENLTIKTKYSGEVTVQTSSVAERKTIEKGFAGQPPGTAKSLPPESPWSGSVDLGLTFLRGNTMENNFYAETGLVYETEDLENEAKAQYHYTTSEGETTEDRGSLSDQLNVNLGTVPYVYGSGAVGFDRIRKIDLFAEAGLGAGLRLLQESSSELNVEGGFTYRIEQREDADDEDEMFARVAQRFHTTVTDRVELDQKLAVFPSLTDSGEFRTEASASFRFLLGNNLSLKMLGEHVYDSDPPPDVDRQDLRFVTTFGYRY